MKYIPLTRGKSAMVDDEDYARVSKIKWFCSIKGYAVHSDNKNRKCISMHRFILKMRPSKKQVDHINGDKLDNRKCNLRIATNWQNSVNRWNRQGKFPYKGIHYESEKWHPGNIKRFSARLKIGRKTYSKGMFHTIEEAALAYNELAKKHHGEFAYLNKIEM